MPYNIIGIVANSLVIGLGIWVAVRLTVKVIRNRYAPAKSVKAAVVDKQKLETFSKYAGNGKQVKYAVIFSVNGKKKAFYVSEFSYGGYRIGEKGTLKYKGDRLIDFR